MNIRGHVFNGVVVLDGNAKLPEGAVVNVSLPDPQPVESAARESRIRLPLIPSHRPGAIHLTAECIATLLDEDDVPS